MIKNSKVLSLVEVKEKLEKQESTEKIEAALEYIKKFSKLTPAKAKEMRKELDNLDIMKLKERQVVKIIDLLPEDAEDIHKIFVGEDISLDQNEIEKILGIVKKYR